MGNQATSQSNAARSLDARFESLEETALVAWSNHEVAAAVRGLREDFRVFCELVLHGQVTAEISWQRMRPLPTRPPVPPPPNPIGVLP